jgi:hypothetical protein
MKIHDAAILVFLMLILLPQCCKVENNTNEDDHSHSEAYCQFSEQVEQATASARLQSEIFYYLIPDDPTPKAKKNSTHVDNPTLGIVDTILTQ